MNDKHDNAADDRAMLNRIQTDEAIEAFRKQELKRIQLEMAEYILTRLLNGHIDMDRYYEATEQIRRQAELKRTDYARLGKLPREEPADMPSGPSLTDPHRTGWIRPTTRADQARRTPRDAPLG
jgi:hypothetical protein